MRPRNTLKRTCYHLLIPPGYIQKHQFLAPHLGQQEALVEALSSSRVFFFAGIRILRKFVSVSLRMSIYLYWNQDDHRDGFLHSIFNSFNSTILRVFTMCREGCKNMILDIRLADWSVQRSKLSSPCTCLLKFSTRPGFCLKTSLFHPRISGRSEVWHVKKGGKKKKFKMKQCN